MRFHTNLPVKNIQKTISFYSVLFDIEPNKKKVDYAKFLPRSGGLNLAFHQQPDAVAGLTGLHLGIEVPNIETLDATFERLSNAGLVSSSRKTSTCCYAVQDKFWVTDPNGYKWEIYVLLEDVAEKSGLKPQCRANDISQQEKTPACC